MKKLINAALAGMLLLALGGGSWAQSGSHPGYVNLDRLPSLDQADVIVDVRIGGWLLGVARAAAAESGDPDLALLSQIDSVRVRIVRLDDRGFADQAQALADQLDGEGWEEFARVREADHWVQVMVKGTENRIHGITVMAMESPGEALFVNIAGRIEPADIARLLKHRELVHADLDFGP